MMPSVIGHLKRSGISKQEKILQSDVVALTGREGDKNYFNLSFFMY